MKMNILVTGGAGFIGSHLADELLSAGYRVRAFDGLHPQIHTDGGVRPAYLNAEVELQVGNLEDRDAVRKALHGVDAVVHLAARVGVGQSMYQVAEYTATNNLGTAILMEEIVERRLERVVVASSMSIYGEGLCRNVQGEVVQPKDRTLEQLQRRDWELVDSLGNPLVPVPTHEQKAPTLASIYALSKYDQERMCLILGRAYNIPTVALRFFNVYGPRQALSNPYTGVLAIFAAQLLNGNRPQVFEDGEQKRDFVNVKDIARACRLALEKPEAAHHVFNVGTGQPRTISEIARRLAVTIGREDLEPQITGRFRLGDIRHCFADVRLSREVLGYVPTISFDDGLAELANWLEGQNPVDNGARANAELRQRGLSV